MCPVRPPRAIASVLFQSRRGKSNGHMLYTETMRRLLLLIVVGILVMDATGLNAFVSPERCTIAQDSQPDGSCPSLCFRCACCAQPIVPRIVVTVVPISVRQPAFDLYSHRIPWTVPTEVFHVPKCALPTI